MPEGPAKQEALTRVSQGNHAQPSRSLTAFKNVLIKLCPLFSQISCVWWTISVAQSSRKFSWAVDAACRAHRLVESQGETRHDHAQNQPFLILLFAVHRAQQ